MSKRLRIAYAMINCNRRDGSARALNELAERMARRHEVHLFARRVEELDLSGIHWHRMPGIHWPAVLDFTSYHFLADFRIRRKDFDIVHSIGCNARAANVITIQNIQPAKRRFLDAETGNISWARKLTRRMFLDVTTWAEYRMYPSHPKRQAPLFLPVSRGVENELRKFHRIEGSPVKIIPNGADTSKFKPLNDADRVRWRRENGIADAEILLVFVGGEWSRKGLDLAIRALGKLNRPTVKLVVLGKDADQNRYKTLAQECQVASQVLFLGFRTDIATALAAGDIFLFPSWYEAFSLATIEAASCGLPIVATEINGTEDFIIPGETGVFIRHEPDQIAATLLPLLQHEAERRRMGANARRLVEQFYTWDRVADATEEAYLEYLFDCSVLALHQSKSDYGISQGYDGR
jgi:glycosyltransferase involved in cell wall biosynthesis